MVEIGTKYFSGLISAMSLLRGSVPIPLAAHTCRDVIDWGRHGATKVAVRELYQSYQRL